MAHEKRLQGASFLMPVEDQYEDMELWYPCLRMREEGAEVVLAAPDADKTYHGKNGVPCKPDAALNDVDAHDFDGIILAGGYAPDKLRWRPEVKKLVKAFGDSKKLLAFICHAGWIPASAGVVKNVKLTSYHTIKDDLVNAGATWVDEEVVVDGHVISSRKPDDLPAFCRAIIALAEEQKS